MLETCVWLSLSHKDWLPCPSAVAVAWRPVSEGSSSPPEVPDNLVTMTLTLLWQPECFASIEEFWYWQGQQQHQRCL